MFPIQNAPVWGAFFRYDLCCGEKDLPGGILTLACGLAQVSALRPHWGLIHYRNRFESLPGNKKQGPMRGPAFLASPAGFEPTAFRLGAQITVVLIDILFPDYRPEKHDSCRYSGLFRIP